MKYIISTTVFVTCGLMIFSCGSSQKNDHREEEHVHESTRVRLNEAQYQSAGITLGKVEQRILSGTLKVSGMLDVPPQNLITVSLPYAGIVKQTDLLQGMKVKKGQLIAVLEHPDFIQLQQDYIDNQSRLVYLEQEVKRQEELQKENVNSTKVYQQANAEYQSLRARVSGLKQKLSMININTEQLQKNGISRQVRLLAPINGYVTQVNINIGMLVNPNDVICKIVDISHLHVELTVFEKDVMQIKPGQKVRFYISNELLPRKATVYLVGKEITLDRTVRVHCHLDEEDVDLLPGMYLSAYVETQSKHTHTLPSKAVQQHENKSYVFIYKEKKQGEYIFDQIEINKGLEEDGYTEVILPESWDSTASVVIDGAYDLLSQRNVGEEDEH